MASLWLIQEEQARKFREKQEPTMTTTQRVDVERLSELIRNADPRNNESLIQLLAATIHDVPALLQKLAERDAEIELMRARETDLQNALYRWLPHITPDSPDIQGDDAYLLMGLVEPVGPELGESMQQRAIAAERAREEAENVVQAALWMEIWGGLLTTHVDGHFALPTASSEAICKQHAEHLRSMIEKSANARAAFLAANGGRDEA